MSSMEVDSTNPDKGDPSLSAISQNSSFIHKSSYNRVNMPSGYPEGNTASGVVTASFAPFLSNENAYKPVSSNSRIISTSSNTSTVVGVLDSTQPSPSWSAAVQGGQEDDSEKTMIADSTSALERTVTSLRDISTKSPSSPLLFPFASMNSSSPIRRSLAARRNNDELWLHKDILRMGGVEAWVLLDNASPLPSASSRFSPSKSGRRTLRSSMTVTASDSTVSLGDTSSVAGTSHLGTLSDTDSDSSISSAQERHLNNLKQLVDEASLLSDSLRLAERERSAAITGRQKAEDALRLARNENRDVRRKLKDLEAALCDKDEKYKTRRRQLHEARRQYEEALKSWEGARDAGRMWRKILDAANKLLKEREASLAERDELLLAKDELLNVKDVELVEEGARLTKEISALQLEMREKDEKIESWDGLVERLREELAEAVEERDALKKMLYEERSEWTVQREDLTQQVSAIAYERDALREEYDALVSTQDLLSAERDAACDERDAFLLQRHTLMAERDSLDSYIKQLSEENKCARIDLSIAKDKATFLTNKNSELHDTVASLRLQIDRLPNQNESELLEKNAHLRDKNAELRLQVDRLETEVQRWQRKAKDLKEHLEEVQATEEEVIGEYNNAMERKKYYKTRFEEAVQINQDLRQRLRTAEEAADEVERFKQECADAVIQAELMADQLYEAEQLLEYAKDKGFVEEDEYVYWDCISDEEEEGANNGEDEEAEWSDDGEEAYEDDAAYEDEEADLDGLDLDGLDEGVAAVNEDGEIVDTHPQYFSSPRAPAEVPLPASEPNSPAPPAFNPLDPGGWVTDWTQQVHNSRLERWDLLDRQAKDRDARFNRFERVLAYHEAMEALRLERERLNDYRVELVEFKAEINKEKTKTANHDSELRKREQDMAVREAAYWNENDERVAEFNRLGQEYDVWRATCEVKDAELNEQGLAVWRQRRELEKRVERVVEREHLCRKREGEVRWRMMCVDGALADLEPGCWRCVPAPSHLFPPTPPIDFRSLDEHYDQIDDGAHDSQRLWAEERNKRLSEERAARLQDNLDEEHLVEGEDEPFEFSGPDAVQRYLKEERRHVEDMKRDEEEYNEAAEEEAYLRYREVDDKRTRAVAEALMAKADDARGARKAHRLAAERGADDVVGVYDETLAINDGLHGMGLMLEPTPELQQPNASIFEVAAEQGEDDDVFIYPADQHVTDSLSPSRPTSAFSPVFSPIPGEASSEVSLVGSMDPSSRNVLPDLISIESIEHFRDAGKVESAIIPSSATLDAAEEQEVTEELFGDEQDSIVDQTNRRQLLAAVEDNALGRSLTVEELTGAEELSASWEDVVADR